jgi:hypothetical protein
MALRPVSELGLVDLTDLASPTAAPPRAPSPTAASPTKRPRSDGGTPKKSSGAPKRSQAKPRASARPSRDNDSVVRQVAETPRASRAKTSRAVAEKVGVSVTCVVAGAAGVLLGRAAIRS